MILGQLKRGDHQAKCRALSLARTTIWSMYTSLLAGEGLTRHNQCRTIGGASRVCKFIWAVLHIHCRHRHGHHGNANSFINMKSQEPRFHIAISIISWTNCDYARWFELLRQKGFCQPPQWLWQPAGSGEPGGEPLSSVEETSDICSYPNKYFFPRGSFLI